MLSQRRIKMPAPNERFAKMVGRSSSYENFVYLCKLNKKERDYVIAKKNKDA
jgi:hypothetical protein